MIGIWQEKKPNEEYPGRLEKIQKEVELQRLRNKGVQGGRDEQTEMLTTDSSQVGGCTGLISTVSQNIREATAGLVIESDSWGVI